MAARKLELMRRYCETAPAYDRRYEEIQRVKYKVVAQNLPRSNKILDLGCGTGMLLDELAKLGKLVVGVDASPEMLKIAKKRSPGVSLVLADADNLPFSNESFDAVVSITMLQNMPDPSATMKEIARVVKTCGTVILTTLKRRHSLEELKNWVQGAGLKLSESGEIDGGEDIFCVARR